MGEKQQVKTSVKVYEMSSEGLRTMWEENLNPSQQSIFAKAGILPFFKAVTYRTDTALCGAVINFMVDGELTVGESRMQITEEQIRRATGLPSSGKDVTPSKGYNRAKMTMRLTRSETAEIKSGLLVDLIVDPVLQFACKFSAYKLLGLQKPDYIPFKYVETAIEVSQGACFNWCKFVKNRMLGQIKSVRKKRIGSFNYGTILQYLAFQAFGEKSGIPRSDIGHGDPCINAYDIRGRVVCRSKREKRKAREGISYIVENIMREHGHRVLDGSGPEEKDETETIQNPTTKKRTTDPAYVRYTDNIMREHGHRVLGGSGPEEKDETEAVQNPTEKKRTMDPAYVWYTDKKARLEACANEIPNKLEMRPNAAVGVEENGCNKLASSSQIPESGEEQQGQKDKELDCVHTDLSTLLREKSMWEAQKIYLESEKLSALEEKKQLQLQLSGLEIVLRQEIQISTSALEEKEELQIQNARLQTELKRLRRKLNKISEFIEMELGDI